jgi:Carboxypeptidase regulatory-like domain
MVRPVSGACLSSLVAAGVLACLLGSTRMAAAQTGGLIEGTVKDEQGGVLPGATVTIRNEESGFERNLTSDADGRYRFAALPPAKYGLKVELAGFATHEVHDIVLTIGLELKQDFTLKLRSLQENVTVTAESPVVDTTKSEVAGVVTQQQIQTLPVNSRQYLNLALLMPGTSQDGARAFYNNVSIASAGTFYSSAFLVDNVTNTWAEQGEPRQNFPQDAVREFKVNTLQFKAEYGLATGGLVTVVTKSGTNQFHGDAFEYFRDKSLNTANVFETEKPPFRRNQFGGAIGGPFVQNKWQFFAAAERTQTDEFFTVNTGKPQFYSAVEGTFPKPSHTNLYTFRTDSQLNAAQSIFVRYAQEDEKRTCFSCGGTASATNGFDQSIPRRAVVVGHTWVQSRTRVNEIRFQYAFSMYQIAPAGTPIFTKIGDYPAARVGPTRVQRLFLFPSLSYGGNFDELGPEQRYQIKDEYSIHHNNHDFKFGVDFSQIPFKDDSPGNLGGTYTFSADQFFNPNDPASVANLKNPILYTQQDIPVNDSVPTKHLAGFIQDDWKARSNLSVSLGLRYDVQPGAINENLDLARFPRPLPYVDPSKRGDWNNLGPRAGFVYDVTNDGATVVRGGYGVYYDNIRVLTNFGEWRNLRARTIVISNPPYPDPFLGQDPLKFISTAPPNITIMANDFVNPYSQQYNLGVTRQIAGEYALSVDGVYTRVRDDRKTRDLNLRDPVTGVRPDPTWGRIDQIQSVGDTRYKAMYVRLDKRMSRRHQFLVSYTLAKAEDNNLGGARFVNQLREGDDFGPSGTDRRHTLVASGAVLLPGDVQFGAVWTLRSTLPFNARAGRDLNGDGFSGDPSGDYVPGTTRDQGNRDLDLNLVNAWRTLNGLQPISASQIDSSRFNSIDVRASKTVTLQGTAKVELIAQVFNILNTKNLLAPFTSPQVTNALSDSFGRILTAKPGTQAELGVRFLW